METSETTPTVKIAKKEKLHPGFGERTEIHDIIYTSSTIRCLPFGPNDRVTCTPALMDYRAVSCSGPYSKLVVFQVYTVLLVGPKDAYQDCASFSW